MVYLAVIPPEEWLKNFKEEGTRDTYRNGLVGKSGFFTFVGMPAVKYIRKFKRQPEKMKQDIVNWFNFLNEPRPNDPKRPRVGASGKYTYKEALLLYLDDMGVRFEGRFWKNINSRQIGDRSAQTIDEVPEDPDTWARIIHAIPKIKYKAFYLCKMSLVCRTKDLLYLTFPNLLIHNEDDIEVILRKTKSGVPEKRSLNKAARVALLQHLKELEDEKKSGKFGNILKYSSNFHKYTEQEKVQRLKEYDERVFPFSATTVTDQWHEACKKVGVYVKDDMTGWARLRPHNTRKYGYTRLSDADANKADAYIGHLSPLQKIYDRHSPNWKKKFFKDNEHRLDIFGDGKAVGELKDQVRDQGEELANVKQEKKDVESQLNLLKRQSVSRDEFETFKKQLDNERSENLEAEKQAIAEKMTKFLLECKTLDTNTFSEYFKSLPTETQEDRKKIFEMFLKMVNDTYEKKGYAEAGISEEEQREYEERAKKLNQAD